MRAYRIVRRWDRVNTKFVEVPIDSPVDSHMSCSQCRYYSPEDGVCDGVGSAFYGREVPFPEYVPKIQECDVRLPPDLLTYV